MKINLRWALIISGGLSLIIGLLITNWWMILPGLAGFLLGILYTEKR